MTELAEEIFGYAHDAIENKGLTALNSPGDLGVPIEDIVDLLLPDPEAALVALHELADDEEERLPGTGRQNLLQAILRAAEGLPGLALLYSDPILQEYID